MEASQKYGQHAPTESPPMRRATDITAHQATTLFGNLRDEKVQFSLRAFVPTTPRPEPLWLND
jgi:hypothetical protein